MTQARDLLQYGQYELISRLGQGGMGEVWRARHRLLSRPAAVKLIRAEALSIEAGTQVETLLRRFEREAQATSALQSPHTVDIYDFGVADDGTFYYAMELLEGLDLQTLVARYGPLRSERVVHILQQVCESLAEAHHQKLIHRDLKPANIFLTRRHLEHDVVKVLDFGLVKSTGGLAADRFQLTMTGVFVGSPAFASPEAIRGSDIDERVDLYALGCVAYWLLTGHLVFQADSIPEMLADHLQRAPVPPSTLAELEIPAELERLVLACLEKEPDNRPESVRAVLHELANCPVERPWDEPRAAAWWRTHRPLEAESPEAARASEVPRRSPALELLDEARAKKERAEEGLSEEEPSDREKTDAPFAATQRQVDWSAYRRGRIAEWSHPRYRLDSEFVALTLLVDQGEETASGRWSAQPERYPRFERHTGPDGDYLLPPMVEIAGGRYPMGDDEPFAFLGLVDKSHAPRHEVEVAPFSLGRFPVTNAEWALFMKAGGYVDERWWVTPAARRWRSGEGTADATRVSYKQWWARLRRNPENLDDLFQSGQGSEEFYETWKVWLQMSEAAFDAELRARYPGRKQREPELWHDERFNNPAQPVVGVCWFEALAYTHWLSAQAGMTFRLPTEAEWEVATRGQAARLFAWGDAFDPLKANVTPTRMGRPTPVGIFPEGDTPEGVSDLSGNVSEWTSSLFGVGSAFDAEFGYPYRADDAREELTAPSDVRRVLRGGSWDAGDFPFARSSFRCPVPIDYRESGAGLRVAL